jgi:outer membrane protein TolC
VKRTLIAVGFGFVVLAGCDRALPRSGTGFDLESQAAAVERNRLTLEAARRELAAATPRVGAPPDSRLVAARAEFDRAYAVYQRRLATFLGVALNEFPQDPATRRVLELYADEAVRWSWEVERRGGDVNAARQRLREVVSHFEAIGAPAPAALVQAAGP